MLGAATPEEIAPRVAGALSAARHARPLLFLPYLSGERVPFWDADLRAAFLGLSREHGPADLVWATLEGVAFLNRIVLGRAETAAGLAVDEVRLGGGAARIAAWAQIKADVLERPVVTVTAEEPGVLGAAIAAFVGLGTFESLEEAQQRLVRVGNASSRGASGATSIARSACCSRRRTTRCAPLSHQLSKLAPFPL